MIGLFIDALTGEVEERELTEEEIAAIPEPITPIEGLPE